MSWQVTIRTGTPEGDRQQVEAYRAAAAHQGLAITVTPLGGGGMQVVAHPRSSPPPAPQWTPPAQQQPAAQQWGQPAQPAQQWGQPAQQAQQWGQPAQQPSAQPQQWGQPAAQAAQAQQWGGASGGFGGFAQPAMAGAAAATSAADPREGILGSMVAADAPAMTQRRLAYLRKVYSLLSASAVIAIGAGWVTTTFGPTQTFYTDFGTPVQVPFLTAIMLASPPLMGAMFAVLFASTFVASWVSKIPVINVAALFGVAGLMGVQLAPMIFVAQVYGGLGATMVGNPVGAAGAMTLATFAGITGYIFLTRQDFSYLRGALSMGFAVIFVGCIVTWFYRSEPFTLAIATGGAMLASGFLLYVTSHIMRNSKMDDAVGDALALLVQLRNLFMFLLRIFMSSRR